MGKVFFIDSKHLQIKMLFFFHVLIRNLCINFVLNDFETYE